MRRIYVFSVCFAAVGAVPLSAQGRESTDVQLRNDCRLAAQIVRAGHPAPHREWAYDIIRECSETGPQALADRWRTAPPVERQELRALLAASAAFRTRVVFDAVAAAASTPAVDETARVYAIALLHHYASGLWLSIDDLLQPRGDRPARIYASSHDASPDDPDTLGEVAAEVEAILSQIVHTEPGSRIGRAASEALRMV